MGVKFARKVVSDSKKNAKRLISRAEGQKLSKLEERVRPFPRRRPGQRVMINQFGFKCTKFDRCELNLSNDTNLGLN